MVPDADSLICDSHRCCCWLQAGGSYQRSHNRWRCRIYRLTPVLSSFGQPMQSLFSTSSAITILKHLYGQLKSSERPLLAPGDIRDQSAIEVTLRGHQYQAAIRFAEAKAC